MANYIATLQEKLRAARRREQAVYDTIADLRAYLLSPKFHADTTVQCADILRWMDELVSAMNRAEDGE